MEASLSEFYKNYYFGIVRHETSAQEDLRMRRINFNITNAVVITVVIIIPTVIIIIIIIITVSTSTEAN